MGSFASGAGDQRRVAAAVAALHDGRVLVLVRPA
jgi:hypothetical protein